MKFPKARLRHTTGKDWQGQPTGHQRYYAKLAKRYYGPFQILRPINEVAYKLKLPIHWLIHNAFHISLVKPYKGEPPKEPAIEILRSLKDMKKYYNQRALYVMKTRC